MVCRRPLAASACWSRARRAIHELRDRLAALGAEVLAQPGIEIAAAGLGAVDAAWRGWTSSIGWSSPAAMACATCSTGCWPSGAICGGWAGSVGGHRSRHGRRAGRYHLKADLVPGEYCAEALAEALLQAAPPGTVSLPGQTAAGRCCPSGWRPPGRGRQVVATRRSRRPVPTRSLAALAAGRIDWVTVTSSAIARSLAALFGGALGRSRLASISPVTSAVLRGLGDQPAAEATEYTMAGLVAAIVAAERRKKNPRGGSYNCETSPPARRGIVGWARARVGPGWFAETLNQEAHNMRAFSVFLAFALSSVSFAAENGPLPASGNRKASQPDMTFLGNWREVKHCYDRHAAAAALRKIGPAAIPP